MRHQGITQIAVLKISIALDPGPLPTVPPAASIYHVTCMHIHHTQACHSNTPSAALDEPCLAPRQTRSPVNLSSVSKYVSCACTPTWDIPGILIIVGFEPASHGCHGSLRAEPNGTTRTLRSPAHSPRSDGRPVIPELPHDFSEAGHFGPL